MKKMGPIYALITALITLSAIEGASWMFFRLAAQHFRWASATQFVLDDTQLENLRHSFDAELGWRSPHDGPRPAPIQYHRPLLASFGDSFTKGDEVEDGETWQSFLAERIGGDVANYGVSGYGTDQALLRFRQVRDQLAEPFVAMGLITESINRTVNVFRRFYYPQTGIPMTKPRFVRERGALRLVPNPVAQVDDLAKLKDPAFIHDIGQMDHWYQGADEPLLVFPYSRLLFDPRVWRQALANNTGARPSDVNGQPHATLWGHDRTRVLYLTILDAFVEETRASGRTPLLLISPVREDLDRAARSQASEGLATILDHCAQRGYLCFDGVAYLAKSLAVDPGLKSADLYKETHLSARGNELFARGVHAFLKDHTGGLNL